MKTLLALLLLAAALRAEDATPKAQAVQVAGEPGHYSVLTTARGTTYRDVRVKSVTASLIKFMHVDGMATLPLIEMPLLLQELHGFNPREAAAELPLVKQQRLKGLAEAAESKAAQAALLERQKAEHNAIRAIEGQKIKLRLDTTQVKPDGTQCDAWRIVMVEIKGKHSLSSGLMQQEGITQELPLQDRKSVV